jgi:hypothetical protein
MAARGGDERGRRPERLAECRVGAHKTRFARRRRRSREREINLAQLRRLTACEQRRLRVRFLRLDKIANLLFSTHTVKNRNRNSARRRVYS